MAESGNGTQIRISMGMVTWGISVLAIVVSSWVMTTAKLTFMEEELKNFTVHTETRLDQIATAFHAHENLAMHPITEERLRQLEMRLQYLEQNGKPH